MAQSLEIGPFHFQTRPLCRVFSFQENSHDNTGNRIYSRGSTCDNAQQGWAAAVQQVNAVADGQRWQVSSANKTIPKSNRMEVRVRP